MRLGGQVASDIFEMMGTSVSGLFQRGCNSISLGIFTEVLKLDPERLWVTVHHSDDEAADIWENTVGVPSERIQRH